MRGARKKRLVLGFTTIAVALMLGGCQGAGDTADGKIKRVGET